MIIIQKTTDYFIKFLRKKKLFFILFGISVLCIALAIFFFITINSSSILLSNLDLLDSNKTIKILEANNINYKLEDNNRTIKVPTKLLTSTRLLLLKEGINKKGNLIGYDIFDQHDMFGATSFGQNIKLIRALEGELTNTIESFEYIEKARVHLVIPQKEIFTKDKALPKASVMLTLVDSKNNLNKNEVNAISSLVASSVPYLEKNNVTLINHYGKAIKIGGEEDEVLNNENYERKIAIENRIKILLEDLLEKSLGKDKVKAQVSVDMGFDRIVTTSEIYDRDSAVPRSSQITEDRVDNNISNSDVNVLDNQGDNFNSVSKTINNKYYPEKIDQTINYEISKTVKNQIHDDSHIKRMSVAVLVDGNYMMNEQGDYIYVPRSEDDIKIIDSLVKASIGYNALRNDVVKVHNMQFVENIPVQKLSNKRNDILKFNNLIIYLMLIFLSFLTILYFYKKFFYNTKTKNTDLSNKNHFEILNNSIRNDIKLSQNILNKWINE